MIEHGAKYDETAGLILDKVGNVVEMCVNSAKFCRGNLLYCSNVSQLAMAKKKQPSRMNERGMQE